MKLKRSLALLLALSACFAFAACEEEPAPAHEHSYASEWTKDGDNHWHACTGTDCTEVADKAAHSWNAGEITTEASASADGVKTYTCTVCAQTKTEAVPYVVDTEVTAEEWLAALSFANEDNYKIYNDGGDIVQVTEVYGATVRMQAIVGSEVMINQIATKAGDKYYAYSIGEYKVSKIEIQESTYTANKRNSMDTTFLFEDFTYNAESKTYKAETFTDAYDTVYTNVEVAFENGKLVAMSMTYLYMGTPVDGNVVITYGNVQEIAVPTNTVDETQMLAAIANAQNNQVSKKITESLGNSSIVYTVDGGNYSYVVENGSEYIFVVEGLKIYNRAYDDDASAWGEWEVTTSQSEASFKQSYDYMHKPNLFLQYYAPASFADMSQETDGGYAYTNAISGSDDYDSYKVYFVNGKLTKFVVYDGSDAYTLVYEYGDYTVEIPQI